VKRFLWTLTLVLIALIACTQEPAVPSEPLEPTGTIAQAFTGTYTTTVTWTTAGCMVCGATTYGCYSLGDLNPLTFTDQTPVGGIVTSATVVLNGVYTSTSVDVTIDGTAIGAPENPGNDGLDCNACESPSWSLTNGSGIPGWVYRGTNTLAVQVGNNDACIHDAVVTVGYTYTETSTTSVASSANPAVYGQAVTFTATVTPLSNGPATGTVTFADGVTPLGTATLNGADQAFLSVSTLTPGTHTIHATYNGDSNFQSSSGTLSQVVNQASTITALASSVNPSIVGQSVTFTATVTVSAPGTGTPTGLVTFLDGPTPIGTATVGATGVATFATAALAVGTHLVTASYGGSSLYLTSASSAVDQVVRQDATTVALLSSLDPSTFGASVTFTATVTTQSTGGTPTGTVTFTDGGTPIGTSSLNGSGVATFSTTALTGGVHTIGAAYSGDADHDPASGSLVQTVDVGPSTTTLASAANPSVFGQPVQLTATVTGTGTTPTGTVTFLDGGAPIGSATLNGAGQATLTTSTLAVGSHSLTASYAGDGNFAASTSSPLSQVVGEAGTTTTVTSSSNPSVVGAPVTFSAQVVPVAPGAGTPAGTVTFFDGGTTLGSGTLGGSGIATLVASSLTVGTHVITAAYAGSASFLASTSGPLSQIVNTDGVTATLTSSLNPSAYGASVTFTATVTTDSTGGPPTGTVTFADGGTPIGSGALNGSGVATLTTTALSGGSHAMTAVYGGDVDHAGGSSSALTQIVNVATSTTGITSSTNPSVFGQSISIVATVTSSAMGAAEPSGSVTFSDGATTLGTAMLDAFGVATFPTSQLAVGTHMLVAVYAGDSNYASSASTAMSQVVGQASTATVVSSSSNPASIGTAVTFSTAVAAVAPGSGTPTGTVTFFDGTTTLGTGTLNGMGVATIMTSALTSGSHSITAAYAGDSSFLASTSAALSQEISSVAATVTLAAMPSPTTYGAAEALAATVKGSQGTPTGSVTFANGTTSLGMAMLDSSGAATVSTSSLPAGSLTLTASYGGDGTYTMASATTMLMVDKAATVTKLASSANPAAGGASVTFTATVTSGATGFTGSVAFTDGTTMLGTAPLMAGAATFSTKTLGEGGHMISATYSGDGNFNGSTSSALTETIGSGDGGVPEGGLSTDSGSEAGTSDGGPNAATSGTGGCGCRVGPAAPGAGFAAILGVGVAAVLLRRRRRA
jgi:MYXO-CTERM domain-containing protein